MHWLGTGNDGKCQDRSINQKMDVSVLYINFETGTLNYYFKLLDTVTCPCLVLNKPAGL